MVRFRKKAASLCYLNFGLLICFAVLINLSSSADTNVMKIQHPKSFLRYNNELREKKNVSYYEDDESSYIPYDLQVVVEALLKLNDTDCLRDGKKVLEAIARRERWALKLFDSSSKFPVGILFGSYYQMGNFDECLAVKQLNIPDTETAIQGQYCLADVELFRPKEYDGRFARSYEPLKKRPRSAYNSTVHWSICVPSSCTPQEVEIVVKEIFTLATDHKGITVKVDANKCTYNKNIPWSVLEIAYGIIIGIIGVFTLMATGFHYLTIRQKKRTMSVDSERRKDERAGSSTLKEVIICFSLIKTIGKFLSTKSSDLNLECISGIKFWSMGFIITGHSMLFMLGGPIQNTDFFEKESVNMANAIFFNSPLLVDTFLLVSGFLMCYLFIIELEKRKGRINFLFLYLARYNRLTPSYLVLIGFYCTLFYRIGDGPLWNSRVVAEQERCMTSWWTNLLYINNYVNTENLCMFQSWYLAVDFHLFIIAPFVIYPLWKWPKFGKAILCIGMISSIIIPFTLTLVYRQDPTLMVFPPEVYDLSINQYFVEAYTKTHMRASSYFLGLALGYFIYKLQCGGKKIPSYIIWLGWVVSASCGILSMFSVTTFYSPDHEYNVIEASLYAALHRVAWCISIGWVIVACITDNAVYVNKFLSWKLFIPFGRLTYCAYLVNGFIEIYSFSSLRSGIFMSKFNVTNKVVAHLILTFIGAFVICILFESPIHGLEKILLRAGGPKKKKQVQESLEQPTTSSN